MKKLMLIFLAAATMFSVTSCKNEPDKQTISEPQQQVEEKNEFYEKMTSSTSRPIAVMIDNDSEAARPQSGLEDAFAIYEIMVEGIATRMMALYLDSDTIKVGPVRSSRHYFLDYALEHDAIYAHCGYSPQAANDIAALGVNNINEISANNGTNFFRDRAKSAPHNLYTSIPELKNYAEKRGYKAETDAKRVFSYSEKHNGLADGTNAIEISLPYNSAYAVSYTYNAETKLYERYINAAPHTSESSGAVISVKNIIIYKAANYSIDLVGRQNLENIGSGSGFYVTEGKYIPITWTKNSRREKTEYTTESGEKLILNPGNSFVQIMPITSEITIK